MNVISNFLNRFLFFILFFYIIIKIHFRLDANDFINKMIFKNL